MEIRLSKSQIIFISERIKRKGVNYTDVNMEMTDHIASEVEEVMAAKNLEFSVALKEVFSNYGRFHFMKIEEEQVKKLEKQSWISLKLGFISFFTFPKIAFTLGLFFMIYKLIMLGGIDYIMSFYLICFIVSGVTFFVLKRKWLGKGTYLQLAKFHGIIAPVYCITPQMINLSFDNIVPDLPWLASALITLMLLVILIALELYRNEFLKMRRQYA